MMNNNLKVLDSILSRLDSIESELSHAETGLSAVNAKAEGAPQKTLNLVKQNGIELPHSKVITAAEDRLLINGEDLLVKGEKGDTGLAGTSKFIDSYERNGKFAVGGNDFVLYQKELEIREKSPVRVSVSLQHSISFNASYAVQTYSLFLDGKRIGGHDHTYHRNPQYPSNPLYFFRTEEFLMNISEPGIHKLELKVSESGVLSDIATLLCVGVSYL